MDKLLSGKSASCAAVRKQEETTWYNKMEQEDSAWVDEKPDFARTYQTWRFTNKEHA